YISGTISRITGGSGASLLDTQQAVADAVAEKRRLDEMAGDTAHYNEQQRADFRRQSEGIDLQNMQRWENQAQYAPTPGLAGRMIEDRGAMYRMGRSFLMPGDLNATTGNYLQDIGQEISALDSQEATQRSAMGGKLPDYIENQYRSQRNQFMNERIDTANDLADRFARQIPAITVGGTSFEEAYMPSMADFAGEFESVGSRGGTSPAVRQELQLAGGRNLGYTRSSTFDAYMGIFAPDGGWQRSDAGTAGEPDRADAGISREGRTDNHSRRAHDRQNHDPHGDRAGHEPDSRDGTVHAWRSAVSLTEKGSNARGGFSPGVVTPWPTSDSTFSSWWTRRSRCSACRRRRRTCATILRASSGLSWGRTTSSP